MKNKVLYVFLAFLIIGLLPTAFVSAENVEKAEKESKVATSTENMNAASLQALIEQLQSQIKELQEQLAKLKSEVAIVKEEIKITKELYKGVSGNEVKEVQKFLKQFSEIYPEGLVTGYYGPLTEKAVKKFQEREGLEPTGKIDATTKKSINEYLSEGGKKIVICHYPPENPNNKQTLEISESAKGAHLAHGDTVGACEAQPTAPAIPATPATPAQPSPGAGTPATPIQEVKATPTVSPGSLETEADIQKEISNLQSTLLSISPGTSEYSAILSKISALQERLAKLQAVNVLINSSLIQVSGTDRKDLCVLTKDGLVYCNHLEWMIGSTYGSKEGFAAIPGLIDIASIAAGGERFACAVKKDGSAYCWGNNGYGQLGDGTFTTRANPVQVFGLGPGTTASISVGSQHACALKTDGSVVCWGSNDSSLDGGQIGDGTTEVVRPKPTQVVGLGPGSTSAVYSNNVGNCAVKTDNSIVCWGSVHANGYSGATKPVKISVNIGKVKQLMPRFKMTCALKDDNSVVCWGQNYCGQLGNGTKTGAGTPTQVIGLGPGSTSAISSESGYYSSALKTDGSVVSWGCAAPGDGTVFNKYSPIKVSGLSVGTTAVIAKNIPCAIKTDGSVVCWSGGLPNSVPGLK